jgi:microsomal dipeptidase-like Zn-dependent dipeptidase
MLIDLHAHYPMHVVRWEEASAHAGLARWQQALRRARFVNFLSRLFNYEGPGGEPGVTVALMRDGDVGAILSVLYSALDEMDLSTDYGAPPDADYIDRLLLQLEAVERDVADHPDATIARSNAELRSALDGGTKALIHAVEGGFHLGGTPAEVRRSVERLADAGVVYVTLAHLFWRDVATNAPALPFVPDPVYRVVFRQPRRTGLSELGETAAAAMMDKRVLIDLTHMSERAVTHTLDFMDERDPDKQVPVLATHEACRLGLPLRRREYNLTDEAIRRVAARQGLIGVILCPHYTLGGGLFHHMQSKSFEDSMNSLFKHIDHLFEITGSTDHVGIGSDLDGWIKPALTELGHLGRMAPLQESLRTRYGADVAEKISSGNALRVLQAGWR